MADHFYQTTKGAMTPSDVTLATSSAGTTGAVEVRIHDGDGTTQMQVLNCLEAIIQYIIRAGKPA